MTRQRVVVAMSGGVDSSVTAALLLQQGYEVIGITMQVWDNELYCERPEYRGCCSLSAVDDARAVANFLGIPYYVVNFREPFHDTVIRNFIDEYAAGRTPNPCIVCNRYVKFERLLDKALQLEADFVATGHYARIEYDDQKDRYLLRRGLDPAKDQSYVLYNFTQFQLSKYLLPIGHLTKDVTRRLAHEIGLQVADKPDSQEICFIPDNDYRAFLKGKAANIFQPGEIVDLNHHVLGHHDGVALFTIGQRKGLGIAASQPLYVIGLDAPNRRVIVGSNDDLYANRLIAADMNFIPFDSLSQPLSVTCKIRYGAQPAQAMISPVADGTVCVDFVQPQRAITAGQSVVFYDGDYVLGGGIIQSAGQDRSLQPAMK